MNKDDAIAMLINAAELAQKRGTFNLKEASLVLQAVEVLQKKDEPETTTEVVDSQTE